MIQKKYHFRIRERIYYGGQKNFIAEYTFLDKITESSWVKIENSLCITEYERAVDKIEEFKKNLLSAEIIHELPSLTIND